MSRLNTLKEKLANREPILSTTISNLCWSGLVQKAATFPFDFMMFDLEHGTLSTESIEEMLRICRLCDLPSVVRVADSVPHLISKTLDMGADGILIPRVETLTQVETAVRCMRYYPRGRKGCGGFANFRAEDCGSVEIYNDNRLLFVQIESGEGLQILPQLLTQYGPELAGIIIGPYDASIMLGTPFDIGSPEMLEYIGHVFDICRNYGISCGSFVDDASLLARYQSLGANVFWTGSEISLLCESYRLLCDTFAKTTETT